jgi:hypothetical protein
MAVKAVLVASSGPVGDESYEIAYPIAQSIGVMRKRRRATRDGKVAFILDSLGKDQADKDHVRACLAQ